MVTRSHHTTVTRCHQTNDTSLDHLEQLADHVADPVLDLVELPVVHERRRAHDLKRNIRTELGLIL